MSDNPDGRAILASLPVWFSTSEEIDIPLAVLPCLRAETHPLAPEEAPLA